MHQTFKGTAQRGVLADCWFGQSAYLITQPAHINTASPTTMGERAMYRLTFIFSSDFKLGALHVYVMDHNIRRKVTTSCSALYDDKEMAREVMIG